MLILNLSTHPLTGENLRQIATLAGEAIDEVRDVWVQFDHAAPFTAQATGLLDGIGLAARDWQTRGILLVPPGHSLITAVLLAEIHGRVGQFPSLVRLRPVEGPVTRYEAAEIINLNEGRSRGRGKREG